MTLAHSIETGQVNRTAAHIYEEFFVPALFQRWAARVADAASIRHGQSVLDVACGTGALTREVAKRVGPSGAVTGLDINDGMLAVAREQAPSVEWKQGEAEALPFADASFDAVVSQFGLMFFRDRKLATQEMLRVLRPEGKLAIAVWGRLENTPGYAAAAALLERLFGAQVAESLRSPYVLGDPEMLERIFTEAGASQITIQTCDGVVEFPSIDTWMHTDIKGWTLADAIDDSQFALLLKEARIALAEFVHDDGRVRFSSPAHIACMTKR